MGLENMTHTGLIEEMKEMKRKVTSNLSNKSGQMNGRTKIKRDGED